MRNFLTVLFILMLSGLITACTDSISHKMSPRLVQLDSLLQQQTTECSQKGALDSLMNVLQHFSEDSLYLEAMAYYDSRKLPAMQARIHFLCALRHRNESNPYDAMKSFLWAAAYAQEAGDKQLLAHTYQYMGRSYYYARIDSKSDSLYHLAGQLAQELADTALWVEAIYTCLDIRNRSAWQVDREKIMREAKYGIKLAHASGNKEYEARLAMLVGIICQGYGHDEAAAREALDYGRQAEQLGLLHAHLLELMAKSYVVLGKRDSAALYFDKLYGGSDWRERGVHYLWMKAHQSPRNDLLPAAEEAFQKERQKQNYEGFLSRYKYAIAGIVAVSLLGFGLLRAFYRRRYRRQRLLLLEQQEKAGLLYNALHDSMLQYEREVAALQERLAEREAQLESDRQILSAKIDTANQARKLLAKEALEHSPAYTKMQLIIADCQWKEKSASQLDETDWQALSEGVNACRNDILMRLTDHYGLTDRDVQLCILLVLDLPVTHIAYLMEYSRPTIYRNEHNILKKMGEKYEKGKLRNLLKSI
ncbi:MAG: hypothetical protein IJ511_10445 [Bacteroides sp.]|nr:hypothetical protein [Bacteroides sp.]